MASFSVNTQDESYLSAASPISIMSPRGVPYTNFNGTWELDSNLSDNPVPFLKLLGKGWMEVRSQSKPSKVTHVISHDDHDLRIRVESSRKNPQGEYMLLDGVERSIMNPSVELPAATCAFWSPDHSQIRTYSKFTLKNGNFGELYTVRSLAAADLMVMDLNLKVKDSTCAIRRTFRRIPA